MRTLTWLCLLTVSATVGCAKTQTSDERSAGGADSGAMAATGSGATVVGRLVIDDGTGANQLPAPGMEVALENGPAPIETDANGNFSMTVPAGDIAISTSLTDGTLSWYAYGTTGSGSYGIEQHGITVTLGQETNLNDVLMHWSADIKGVVQAGGSPVAGATVQVPGTVFKQTTDATGAFDLSVPATTWTVQVTMAGYQSYESQPVTLTGKQVEDFGTLALQAQ